MTQNKIRLIIADDHEIFREGLIINLNKSDDIEVIAEASSGEQLVHLAEKYKPDVILADIKMRGMNGIEATRIITKKNPAIAILALSMMDNCHVIADMIHAGANGYLLKDTPKDKIIEGIRAVSKNKEYFCNGASQKLKAALTFNSSGNDCAGDNIRKIRFTPREKEIMRLICDGLSAEAISKKIYRSVKTIENCRSKLIHKTGCKNVAELAFYISKNNLYDL